MKKVIVIVIALFLCLALFSGTLYAQRHVGFHVRGFHGGGPHISIHGHFGFPYYYPYIYYPYYYPHYYPYYYAYPYPEPYANNAPQVNIEPEQTYYWYYCQNPQGYYPYITSCPGGWTKVVPTPPPPGKDGTVK
jgi:hypothetical protein